MDIASRTVVVTIMSCGLFLPMSSATAADHTASWLSSVSGNWNDATNWSTNPAYPNYDGSTYDAVIDAAGGPYAIDANVVTTIDALWLNSPDATVTQTGDLFDVIHTATIDQGRYELADGVFGAQVLQVAETGEFVVPYPKGIMDVHTVSGDITINNRARLEVINREFILDDATITVNSSAELKFGSSHSNVLQGNGTVVLNGGDIEFGSLQFNIEPGITVSGHGTIGTGGGEIVNRGALTGGIDIKSNRFVNYGTYEGGIGDTIRIDADDSIENTGTIALVGGPNLYLLSDAITNSGTITVDQGSQLYLLSQSLTNSGSINVINGSSLLLSKYTYSTATVNQFKVSDDSTVHVSGATIDNTGSILEVNQPWIVSHSGTIAGGVVRSDGAGQLEIKYNVGFLDNVVLDSDVVVYPSDGELRIVGGIDIQDRIISLEADGPNKSAELTFESGQTHTGTAEIIFNGVGEYGNIVGTIDNNQATLPAGYTIRTGAKGGSVGAIFSYGVISSQTDGKLISLAHGVNEGTVRGIQGGDLKFSDYVNRGLISMADGGTLTLKHGFTNGGVIQITDSTLALHDTFSAMDLGVVNRTGGEVLLHGTLENTGKTLTLDAVTGSWEMRSNFNSPPGTIVGGTLVTRDDAVLIVGESGELDNVVVNGRVKVHGQPSSLLLRNSITLGDQGVISLSGTSSQHKARVLCETDMVLEGTGEVVFDGGSPWTTCFWPNNQTLTIGPDITVRTGTGGGRVGGYLGGSGEYGGHIFNQGTIIAQTPGQRLHVGYGKSTGSQSFTNEADGVLRVTNGGHLGLEGEWYNNGLIEVESGLLQLGGNFQIANIGTINQTGGAVEIIGDLDNTGTVLAISGGLQSLQLHEWTSYSGKITGGRVEVSPGNFFGVADHQGGRLDGVTLAGTMQIGRRGYIRLYGGFTLDNGRVELNAPVENEYLSQIVFEESQPFGGVGEVVFNGDGSNNRILFDGVGDIGADIVIKTGTQGGLIEYRHGPLTNYGSILAQAAGKAISISTSGSGSFINEGGIFVSPGAAVSLAGDWMNNGLIRLDQGTLRLGGTFSYSDMGTIDRTGGEVFVSGTFENTGAVLTLDDTTGPWKLDAGTIRGGEIRAIGSGGFTILPGVMESVFDGVTVSTPLAFDNGRLIMRNTVTLQNGAGVFDGSGEITLGGGSVNAQATPLVIGAQMSLLGGNYGGVIDAAGQPVSNAGTVRIDRSGKTLEIIGAGFTNTGILKASNESTLRVDVADWANEGVIELQRGMLVVTDAEFHNRASGIVRGVGVIDASAGTFVNSGIVAPGEELDTLEVSGDFRQTAAGMLAIEFGRVYFGQTDLLRVSGAADLVGTLTVAHTGHSLAMMRGTEDTLVIIEADTVNGTFDTEPQWHLEDGLFVETVYGGQEVGIKLLYALGGDANGDRDVDISDFNDLVTHFDPGGANAGNDWLGGDFDADADIDISDFNTLASNFSPSGYDSVVLAASVAISKVELIVDVVSGEVLLDADDAAISGLQVFSPGDGLLGGDVGREVLQFVLAANASTYAEGSFVNMPTGGLISLGVLYDVTADLRDLSFEYTVIGQSAVIGRVTYVPEPASIMLVGAAALVVVVRRRRRELNA